MSVRDLHNKLTFKRGLSPVSVADTTAQVSQIIDTKGFHATEFVIITGSLADADATFTTLLEDGDVSNLSDNATVAAPNLLGTAAGASFIFSDDDSVKKIGYIGNKRYVRLTVTPAANSSGALIGIVAVQSAKELPSS